MALRRTLTAPATQGLFRNAPIVVLNNFAGRKEQQLQLTAITLQGMYPSLQVETVRLTDLQRVVLYEYDEVRRACAHARVASTAASRIRSGPSRRDARSPRPGFGLDRDAALRHPRRARRSVAQVRRRSCRVLPRPRSRSRSRAARSARSIKRISQAKLPNLRAASDVADLVLGGAGGDGATSESEFEVRGTALRGGAVA